LHTQSFVQSYRKCPGDRYFVCSITTQEGESTTDDIEQLQSVHKVTFSKTDSTKNSKASGEKNTMKHGQKTLETFMNTPVSHGPKQTVRSHTPPTPPDRQDDQTNKNNGSKKAKV
jgi:hypothetical protein